MLPGPAVAVYRSRRNAFLYMDGVRVKKKMSALTQSDSLWIQELGERRCARCAWRRWWRWCLLALCFCFPVCIFGHLLSCLGIRARNFKLLHLVFWRHMLPVGSVLVPRAYAVSYPIATLNFAEHGVVESGVGRWPPGRVVVVANQRLATFVCARIRVPLTSRKCLDSQNKYTANKLGFV